MQTVVRAEIAAGRSSITDPYALVKELTRGKRIGSARAHRVRVRAWTSASQAKARLLALTPADYIGLASELVDYATE